jgi:hypothetical protein
MTTASGKRRKDPRSDDFSYPKWTEPLMTETRHRDLVAAAKVYAERHASDPFAFGRIYLHMKRGLADPADVRAEGARVTTLQ